MLEKFRYKFDRKTLILSAIETAVLGGVVAVIFLTTDPGYVRAWLMFVIAAILALYILSIPRFIKVTDDAVEIQCIVEMTRIKAEDIAYVKRVSKEDYGTLVVLLGSYGFYGYFGYFYSTRYWETVKVYCSSLRDLVLIEDVYEQKYIVSSTDADRLVELVERIRREKIEVPLSKNIE